MNTQPQRLSMRHWLFTVVVMMVAATNWGFAATNGFLSSDPENRLSTIPHDADFEKAIRDSRLGDIAVRHEGWNETLDSWARLKVHELTGRDAIHGQSPAFTLLSLMYERERWADAHILPVEHPRIAEVMRFSSKWVSLRDVAENEHTQELNNLLREGAQRREEYQSLVALLNAVEQAEQLGVDRPGVFESVLQPGVEEDRVRELATNRAELEQAHERRRELRAQIKAGKAFLEAGERLLNRTMLALTLPEQFLIVPDPEDPEGEWIAASEHARGEGGHGLIQPARLSPSGLLPRAASELDGALAKSFAAGAPSELGPAVQRFLRTAMQSRYYPAHWHRVLTNLYVAHNPFNAAAWMYALAAALFGLFAFFQARAWRLAGMAALGTGLLLHTSAEVIRLLLTGHMPVSNMFESITFASWAALVIGTAFELAKRRGVAGLFASAVGALALIGVGLMPLHDTRLHPLRAVLNSYWLNIHVTMMLISYGTFALAALFAGSYLVKSLAGRESLFGGKPLLSLEQTEEFAYRLVQVAWPVLTVGVCLGAVWADTAWGRYWGWDPKETWALITWIVYTIYLHSRMVMGWKGRVSAIACLAGFLMVMITWLGVSYIPWFAGGLHTYASPTS
ncbi:c-type cytochrome biogenesis protein CcsB [Candidatus Poribacteria bacterium]|nr:c-type cytochrome biogenesis protein CcsB [Candidatus Poribacteria bacterium]